METQQNVTLAPLVSMWASDSFKRLRRRASGAEQPIRTAWPNLNTALGGGLWPGLDILVGLTGSSKTQFALQLGWQVAQCQVPVLFFALELTPIACLARLLGMVSQKPWSDISHGKNNTILKAETEQLFRKDNIPFHVWMPSLGPLTESVLQDQIEAFRRYYPEKTEGDRPALVIVDYLQLIESDEVTGDIRQRIRAFAIRAALVTRTRNLVVLLVSSTARDSYEKLRKHHKSQTKPSEKSVSLPDPRELVGIGKETGEIEYSADAQLVLCPPIRTRHEAGKTVQRVPLALAKVRAGEPGLIVFDLINHSFFEDNDVPITSVNGSGNGDAGKTRAKAKMIEIDPDDRKRL
jgi:replicative DNA helicase